MLANGVIVVSRSFGLSIRVSRCPGMMIPCIIGRNFSTASSSEFLPSREMCDVKQWGQILENRCIVRCGKKSSPSFACPRLCVTHIEYDLCMAISRNRCFFSKI